MPWLPRADRGLLKRGSLILSLPGGLSKTLPGLGLFLLATGCADAVSQPEPVTLASITIADTIELAALGEVRELSPEIRDAEGNLLDDVELKMVFENPTVVEAAGPSAIRAVHPGKTTLNLSCQAICVATDAVIIVRQQPVAVGLTFSQSAGLTLAKSGDSVGVAWALDRNGHRLPFDRVTVSVTDSFRLSIDPAGVLRGRRTGANVVTVQAGGLVATESLIVVMPVRVIEEHTPEFSVAGLPDTMVPWAPTALPTAEGTTLFFAGYAFDSTVQTKRADLHYATSTDGVHFTYRGVALPRDTAYYDYRSLGVENVFVVPRDDGPGCRMFASAGSIWWVWMVFSAVSDNCKDWTWEDGPAVPGVIENLVIGRPAGEGMHVWQDSTGVWWMILGAYPAGDGEVQLWSIGLYRGIHQRSWEYVRTLIYPGPVGRERAAFAPSVVEFAPGLYRMFFAGDGDVGGPGGPTGRIFSAVSRNRMDWIEEGPVLDLGLPDRGPTYSSVVGNRLYYLIHDQDIDPYLAAATIEQP